MFNRGLLALVIAISAILLCSCSQELSAHAQPDHEQITNIISFLDSNG